jgi:hypothetical protein
MNAPKSNFAEELGKLALTPAIDNSYYNDERDVSVVTPDLDKAYAWLCEQKTITAEDLESTTGNPGSGSSFVEARETITGLDVLKITLHGDFDESLDTTSSLEKNYRAAVAVWDAMERGLGKEKTQALWGSKEIGESWVEGHSLAELVSTNSHNPRRTETESALRSIQPLTRKIRELFPKEVVFVVEVNDELKETNPAKIVEAARSARRNDVAAILKIKDYALRICAVEYYLNGISPSKRFNTEAEKIPTAREVIASTTKPGGMEI